MNFELHKFLHSPKNVHLKALLYSLAFDTESLFSLVSLFFCLVSFLLYVMNLLKMFIFLQGLCFHYGRAAGTHWDRWTGHQLSCFILLIRDMVVDFD